MKQQASSQKRAIARLILLVAMGLLAWFIWRNQSALPEDSVPTPAKKEQRTPASQKGIPEAALKVLDYVRKKGEAPPGYVGGRNFENREKRLPQKESSGKKIKYAEWDIYPKISGKNRGPARLVTGSDQSAYYTKDHYKTFQKIE